MDLSRGEDLGEVIGDAAALGREYRWLEAADVYGRALGAVEEDDVLKRGEVQERIGYCLRRAAMQAESQEEFKKRMQRAIEAYEKAYGFYEKLGEEQRAAWMFRCMAITQYLSHWLESDPSEKRKLLDECLELEKKALKTFWDMGVKLEYGKTFNELSQASWIRAYYEWDREARRRLFEEGIAWGERAVEALSELGDLYETTLATLNLENNRIHFLWDGKFIADREEFEQLRLKYIERLSKAAESSERVGDVYLTGYSHFLLGWPLSREEGLPHFKKALERFKESQDNYMKARALTFLAYHTYWMAHGTEDPDQRRKVAEEAMEFYDRAESCYSIMSCRIRGISGKIRAPAPGGYAEYYFDSAEWESDQEKKKGLLEKSEDTGLEALKVAKDSDIPVSISRMSHILSRTLTALARTERDVDKKRSLLEEALRLRERNLEICEQWAPFHYWNNGVFNNLYANIKAELASIQSDPDSRRSLLKDAVSIMEISLRHFNKAIPILEKRSLKQNFASLTGYQDDAASTLVRLYEENNNPSHLRRTIEIWREEIESAEKGEMVSRIAESYWQIAKAQDTLGEHSEAAESFQRASESYVKAAEKIPQLIEFYQDYARYLKAWSEIEEARQSHKGKRYGEAKEHYANAAELHQLTERWRHLSPNYLAWARAEEAEYLSRIEQTPEAKELFQQAARLFVEAKESIKDNLDTIEAGEERRLAEELIKASDLRREYCLGRTALEEARILDRQGDHAASSRKYGQATKRFQKIIDTMEKESERKELRPIINLCQAWQKMMMAEARASPTLYGEAAELFTRAKEHSLDPSTSLLSQAHSSFCRALEAGARFEMDRDTELFSTAKNHIEASTNYYLRAGFRTASEYAKATSRLLDAYMYTYKAQTETDPVGKAQLYRMSERFLQASAGSYIKAKHPEKSEEVRRILDRIKEEREIVTSLSEVLHIPTIASSTASFSTPTPAYEQAVGLERFENADIQANLILRDREVKIGENIDLEIELVNAGKAPAQLIKVEEIIPEGFEVSSAPDICRVEDSYLDMKGRTLNPLKTAELKIVLRPLDKGTYQLKPRVLYLDESGKYRSHEPEPATVVVSELGIKGWLRGPTR